MSRIISSNIWRDITSKVVSEKTNSNVAVAYFGQGGSEILPLRKGSKIVVDLSELAVKSGQTCPAELIKLYRSGVKIYSHERLHAKVFILGQTLYIGSTNVSKNSSTLQEAVFKTNNKSIVKQAKKFVESICLVELGLKRLSQLNKIYRPPKFDSKNIQRIKAKSSKNVYVCNLSYIYYPEGSEKHVKEGRDEAKRNRKNLDRHIIQDFVWYAPHSMKKGDIVIQITHDGKEKFMSPPGTIVNIKKWSKNSFIYLEIPKRRVKNLNSISHKLNVKQFVRNGKKNDTLLRSLSDIWT